VFGYELLFRDGVENYFCPSDAEAASRSTVDTSMLMRLDVLCDGRRAFVNCTRDMLLKDYITLLPSQLTIVEILEWVEADELVVNYIRMLQTVSKPELDSHEVKTSSKVKRPFAIAFCGI
jgi:c-di-GMP-related signal transduction protein